MERYKNDIASVPYDVRQFMPERCCWLQMNAAEGLKVTNASSPESYDVGNGLTFAVTASATWSKASNFGSDPSAYLRMSLANSTSSRGWVGNRRDTSATASYAFGRYESDVTCRTRINTAVATSDTMEAVVGFADPNLTLASQANVVAFVAGNKTRTWACRLFATSTQDIEYDTTYDTGVSAVDWHDLSVWVSKDATKVVFSIDSIPVYSLAASGLQRLNKVETTGCNAYIRRLTGSTTRSMDVAWYAERHFIER